MGVPDMQKWYEELLERAKDNSLDGRETQLFKNVAKTLLLLAENPHHNSLQSHEI